jgi:Vitamin B12 dependent methionine synthase, activation domain
VALSDFIAPRSTDIADYIGAFIVTDGIGENKIADRFRGGPFHPCDGLSAFRPVQAGVQDRDARAHLK